MQFNQPVARGGSVSNCPSRCLWRRLRWAIGWGLSCSALMSLTITAAAAADPDRPHVVIILVDDMGYGDPGCFNPESKIATPHIDRLAKQGMRFTDAHAPGPLCHLSRYGLLTGRYPFRAEVGKWGRRPVIDEDQATLATLARDQGYRTAMVGKWHLGFQEQGYDQPLPGGPVDRGFETFFGIRASTDIPPYFYIRNNLAVQPPSGRIEANRSEGWSPIQGAFWRAGGIAPDLQLKDVLPKFTQEAIQVIQQHAASENETRPLMLYLAYPAPHTPWLPDSKFAGQSQAGMYGDFAMMVDDQVGQVLQTLESVGWSRDTLVVFTSDNGPVWYPEDVERLGHDSTAGLRGMKADAWEGGHRMPFVVRWPERVKPGSTSDRLVCFTDVMATLADVWGTPLPDLAGPDSFSFYDAIIGEPQSERARAELVMQAANKSTWAIRSGDWKLITGLGSGGFSKPSRVEPQPGEPEGQLYHLGEDPGEQDNVYLERADLVQQLTARLQVVREAGRHRQAP